MEHYLRRSQPNGDDLPASTGPVPKLVQATMWSFARLMMLGMTASDLGGR